MTRHNTIELQVVAEIMFILGQRVTNSFERFYDFIRERPDREFIRLAQKLTGSSNIVLGFTVQIEACVGIDDIPIAIDAKSITHMKFAVGIVGMKNYSLGPLSSAGLNVIESGNGLVTKKFIVFCKHTNCLLIHYVILRELHD